VKTKTHAKLNISLPLELHAWCVQKMKSEQRKNRMGEVKLSHVIAHAIKEVMEEEIRKNRIFNEQPGNASALPHHGADASVPAADKTVRPSETSDGGFSTRRTMKYPKAGRRKSST
jgi:hypothetical protein